MAHRENQDSSVEKKQAESKSRLASHAPVPKTKPRRTLARRSSTAQQTGKPFIRVDIADADEQPFQLADIYSRQVFRKSSGFLVSFCIHVALLVLLSLLLIRVGVGRPLVELDFRAIPELEGIDLEVGQSSSAGDEELGDEPDELSDDEAEDMLAEVLASETKVNQLDDSSGSDSQAKDSANIGRGDVGISQGDSGSGSGAKFFGSRVTGNSIVYILDRSGSMERGVKMSKGDVLTRFEAAKRELLRSVKSLQADQKFYVMMFSGSSTSMMNDRSRNPVPIAATDVNKQRFERWLSKTKPFWEGTDPRESLELAFRINPDSIFLLSDGEFKGAANSKVNGVVPLIEKQNVNGIKINTIALEDKNSLKNLVEVSELTGGENRFVSLSEFWEESLDWSPENCLSSIQTLTRQNPDWTDRCRQCFDYGIPLVQSNDPKVREAAQEFLHTMSHHIFLKRVPDVRDATTNQDLDKIANAWTDIWIDAQKTWNEWGRRTAPQEASLEQLLLVGLSDPSHVRSLEPIRNRAIDPKLDDRTRANIAVQLLGLPATFQGSFAPLRKTADLNFVSGVLGSPAPLGSLDDRLKIARMQLIPLLKYGNASQRKRAEKSLHNLSMRLFSNLIPRLPASATQTDVDDACERWHTVWQQVEKLSDEVFRTKKTEDIDDLFADDAADSIRMTILDPQANDFQFSSRLLAYLASLDKKDSMDAILELGKSKDLAHPRIIQLVRALADFQIQAGATKARSDVAQRVYRRVAPDGRSEHIPAHYRNVLNWRTKVEQGLARREDEAKSLYQLLIRLTTGSSRYKKTRSKLLDKFPDTVYASAVRLGKTVEEMQDGQN